MRKIDLQVAGASVEIEVQVLDFTGLREFI